MGIARPGSPRADHGGEERVPSPLVPDEAPAGGVIRRAFSAMADRNFRLLYLGNMLQFGAQQMQLLVRGYLVFQLTGSYAWLGTMALANAVPGLIFSPIGGILADRASKKTVIQVAQGFNAINAAVLALLASGVLGVPLEVWHLFLSSALQGGVNSVMMPSRQSIISDLVGPKRLMNAISVQSSGQTLMQLLGPAAGGFLIKYLEPSAVFWTMAAMYALAVTFTMRLPAHPLYSFDREAGGARPPRRRRHGSLSDVVDGMVYVWREPVLRGLIGVNFLIVIVAMPYTMLLAGFVESVLHRDGFELGMLSTAQGIGALLGSFIVASATASRRGRMMILWGAYLGVTIVAFAISTNYWLTMAIMMFVGAGQTGRMAMGQVLIQTYAAPEYRGRVTAVWFMQFSLVQLGTFFVGLLSEALGPQLAIGGLAALMVVAMGLVWAFVPRIRNLE